MANSDSASSASDPLDNRHDEGWEDVEPDDEPLTIVSLFDEKTFPNVIDMLHYCKDKYNFDVWQVRKNLGKPCYAKCGID
jgi:protein arginine N-methyltransferase 3